MGLALRHRMRAALFVIGTIGAATTAVAQPSDEDRAAARSAATAGATALHEGRFEEAADLFTRAEALMHAPTHLLYLARSQVKVGHLVKARENYLKIVREKLPANAPKAFVDAQAAALAEVAELETRIPTLKVLVEGEGAESATVTMDGQKMPTALTGVSFPINPGEHKFEARTTDLQSEVVTINCVEGSRQALTVALKLTLRTEVRSGAAPSPGEGTVPPNSAGDAPSNGKRTGAWIAFGIGGAGLIAGTIFVVQNRSARSEANDLCAGGTCPESKRTTIDDLDSKADSATTMSLVGYGIGIAGVATGAVLFVMSSKESAPKTGRLAPLLTGNAFGGSFGMRGAF